MRLILHEALKVREVEPKDLKLRTEVWKAGQRNSSSDEADEQTDASLRTLSHEEVCALHGSRAATPGMESDGDDDDASYQYCPDRKGQVRAAGL